MTSNGQHIAHVYIGMAGEGGVAGHGLYRMEAQGGEWTQLDGGLPPDPGVRALGLHPDDPRVVFAGTNKGVYRSEDQGDHWERLDLPQKEEAVWSILFHPQNSRVMFAGYETPEIFRTDDGGETWRPLKVDVEFPRVTMAPKALPKRIIGMSADPGYPDEMYAAIEVGGLIRSLDGGASWEGVTEGLYVNDDPLDVHGVLASSAEPHTVLVITRIGMFHSPDRGTSWQPVDLEKLSARGTYCRSLREAPDDPSTLYLAAGATFRSEVGALYRSGDVGRTWQKVELGFSPKSTLFGVAINGAEPSQMYCCTSDGEVFGSRDKGASWSAHPLPSAAQEVRAIVCG